MESPEVIAVKPGDRGDYKHTIKVAEIYLDQNGHIGSIDHDLSARQYAETLFHNQAAVFGKTGSYRLKIDSRKISAYHSLLEIQPDGGTVGIGSFASGSFPLTISEGATSTKGNVTLDVEMLMTKSTKAAVFTGGSEASIKQSGSGTLLVGSEERAHLVFDASKIMAKVTGTTVGTLNLQPEGGKTSLGGDLEIKGNIGIGIDKPEARLHIDHSETGKLLVLGKLSGEHLSFAHNTVRNGSKFDVSVIENSGKQTTLALQSQGGNVSIGRSGKTVTDTSNNIILGNTNIIGNISMSSPDRIGLSGKVVHVEGDILLTKEMKFSTANSDVITATLSSKNVPKAWARIKVNTGTVSLVDGFNIKKSFELGKDAGISHIRVNFEEILKNSNYSVCLTQIRNSLLFYQIGPRGIFLLWATNLEKEGFDFACYDIEKGGYTDFLNFEMEFSVIVFGS